MQKRLNFPLSIFRMLLAWTLILAGIPFADAQTVDLSKFKNLKPRCIGPAGMSGRVTGIVAVESDPSTIYAGTASGGLWKSENGGINWAPIFDKEAVLSIGAVAVTQQNPSVIWAGTGEGNPRNSQNSGKGIYKSLDAGRTWQMMGLENTKTIHRIIVDPNNENVVYVAALGSAWGPNADRGVFKTIDGGLKWEKILYVNDTTGCAELVIDPSNPNKLLAAMWEYHREPWFFTSGGKGSGLYMTLDGGKTWQQQTEKNGLPAGKLGRMGLAFSRSKPNVVYALIESSATAFYRSDDGGFNWKKRAENDIGNRPFYYAEIFVDPQNENRVYNLWSTISYSEDGAKSFTQLVSFSGVHPDHHAFWIDPNNPEFLIDGNDGGIAISRDGGKSWALVENLPLGQFYHVDYDMQVPYNIMGGLQDNGSYVGPSEVWAEGGIRNYHWREVMFGDGFDVAAKRNDPQVVYAMSQGGFVRRVNKITGESIDIRPIHPEGKALRFNWNAGLALDPHNDNGLYYGSQFLHHSTDAGASWQLLSPDLTTNDSTKQKQAKSGGLTLDATTAENYTTILAIAPSPLQKGLIWVGTDDGNLQLTRDGGQNWTNLIGKLPDAPKGAWIPQIEVSKINVGEAFVILNDYRRNNWEPYAYHTRDFGATWRRIADGKKVSGHCLSIVQDPVAEGLLFLGTDHGLYVSIDAGENWTKWKNDFPSVPVNDLKIHPREHDLIIATFGRAVWMIDDIRSLRMLAKEGKSLLEKEFYLLPIQDAIAAEYRSVDGFRYNGAADFGGGNRGRGANLQVYLKSPGGEAAFPKAKTADAKKENADSKGEKKKTTEVEPPKPDRGPGEVTPKNMVRIHILTLAGDSVRTHSTKADTGFFEFRWQFDRNGSYFPKYNKFPRQLEIPGGPDMPPGQYKAVVLHGALKDSSNFQILPDPRIVYDREKVALREAKVADYLRLVRKGTQAFEQVRDAREMMDRYEKLLENVGDTLRDSLKKVGKPVRDSIRNLMEVYLDPENQKGLEHLTQQMVDRFYTVAGLVEPLYSPPGGNADLALRQLDAEVRRTVTRINHFLENEWKTYRQRMEAAKVPLFLDFVPVKMD
ncbi:MAG: hypothetical protein IPN95_31735 [Bacteroidetes bacterium]|nr:hypothetical protein [Bacteroidota bacterium]